MNVDSVVNPGAPSFPEVSSTSSLDSTTALSASSVKRLDVLSILSSGILTQKAPQFAHVIEHLNALPIDYDQCKLLFVEAYIHDFNEEERAYFLSQFFSHFDPNREITQLDQLDLDSKAFFYERIIRYLCQSYIDFPSESKPLTETFSDSLETEARLETRFDEGMDMLLDFSTQNEVETKILFATYLARLISKLEESQTLDTPSTGADLSLKELFNEVYLYLLHLPTDEDEEHSSLLSLMKEDLEQINPEALQKSFVGHLAKHLNLDEKQTLVTQEIFSEIDLGIHL